MMLFSAIMMITVMTCDNNSNKNNDSTQDKHGGDTTNTDYNEKHNNDNLNSNN